MSVIEYRAENRGAKASRAVAALALGLIATSWHATAQIYEYQWTDTAGVVQAAKPEREWYAVKPGTNVVVTTIAGLDRKVKLEVKKGAEVVFSQTSATITPSNRITASDSGELYGVKFNVPMATEDTFTITSTVTDPVGADPAVTSYQFRVDQTPPLMGTTLVWRQAGWSGGSIDVFGGISGQQIDLSGIEDLTSGIKEVRWFTIDSGGTRRTHASNPTKYIASTKVAFVPVSAAASPEVAPVSRADYTVGFEAEDYAGNKAQVSRVSGIDRFTPGTRRQIKNAITGVWEDYSPGMTIHANPIEFRAGIEAIHYAPLNGTKFGVMAFSGAYAEDGWVWRQATFPVPQSYTYWEFYTTAGTVPYVDIKGMKYTYASGADAAPAFVKAEVQVNGEAWTGASVWTRESVTLTAIKVTAAVRTYRQRAIVAGGWTSCLIEAGSDSCTLTGPVSLPVTPGMIAYNPYPIYLERDDGSLRIHVGYHTQHRDGYIPVVLSKEVDANGDVATVVHEKTVNQWNIYMWEIAEYRHIARNLATGVEVDLPLIANSKPEYDRWAKVSSTKSLPDGNYEIRVMARDKYGNSVTETIAPSFRVDNTAPGIAVKANGAPVSDSIASIADLRIVLADAVDATPIVSRVTLVGGPLAESLEIGVAKVGGEWLLQPPRMFPTLMAGHEYTLRITATDASANVVTKEQKFALVPENLVAMGVVDALALKQQIYDASDRPLHVVKLINVKNKNGTLARGLHSASVTVRSDAAFGLVVNGLPVSPGETKELVINLVNGGANVEMWPAVPGVGGEANYMIYLPQLLVE